jgi:hypothetical protein
MSAMRIVSKRGFETHRSRGLIMNVNTGADANPERTKGECDENQAKSEAACFRS